MSSYNNKSNYQQGGSGSGQFRRRTPYKGPKQPYKYCRNECGRFICYDENHKTGNGGWIPVDYELMQDHECPRNERSPNYNPDMGPIPESLATRPAVREETKKEQPAIVQSDGVTSEQINGILIELRGVKRLLEEKVLENQRTHTQLLDLIANVLKPGPEPILNNLREEYDKNVKAVTTPPVQVVQQQELEETVRLTDGMRNA
jgi:hypothetical protein